MGEKCLQMAMSSQSPQPLYVLRGLDSAVHSVKFLSSNLLVSGCQTGVVTTWNLKTLRKSAEEKTAHSKGILGFEPVSTEEFWSHGRDGKVCLWRFGNGNLVCVRSLDLLTVGFCQCCSVAIDSKPFICGAWDGSGELAVLDVDDGALVAKFRPRQSTPTGMCMAVKDISDTEHTSRVLTAHEDGLVRTWDLRDTREPLSSLRTHSDPIFSCAFDGNQQRGVVAGAQSSLVSFSVDSSGQLSTGKAAESPSSGVTNVDIRKDSKLMLCSLTDGRLMAYSWKSMKTLAVMSHHLQTVHTVSCAPAGAEQHVFAAGGKDCTVSLWSLYK
ncbi:guanine nucleotide-binding protein subunit beta-like protein 1 isoform X2 [Sycon ciliatum]|uniref:guanine nucleotide-binding protein subunit beta-like protein 1 isoform X2 n=1 Tax=Sycon ciliatum TaxID=27933 RepID=UPI0020A89D5D|eukprot:scpid78199/ scgid21858/ Guanine nucleotide-binding protein subunit beta-like protein 1; WD repeat-containing protein 14; WD40 repeat-containing protein deleted in VCFS